jgi:hypothetical protein
MRIGRIAAAGLFFALLTTVLPVGTQMASAAVTLVGCPAANQ